MFEYQIYLDVDRDGNFSNGLGDITKYVISCDWAQGLNDPWGDIASAAYLTLQIDNHSGDFNLTDPNAKYYSKLNHGTLIRVQMSLNGTTTQAAVLKTNQLTYLPDPAQSENGEAYQLQITCEDPIAQFLSTEFAPKLRENVRVDQALEEIFDQSQFIYPYDGAWFYIGTSEIGGPDIIYDYTQENLIDFEESYTTLNYSGDNLDRGTGTKAQSYIRDLMKAEFSGIFFWDIRSEQFKFYNRHHNRIAQLAPYIARASSYTFDMSDIVRFKSAYGEGLVNDVTINYYPRKVGATQSVVATSSAVPFAIAAKDSRSIRLRAVDPNNTDISVGVKDWILPTMGLDIVGNSMEDGSGEDWTRYLQATAIDTAEKTEIIIRVTKVGDPVFITTLQRRGTPLLSYNRETINVTDSESRRLYDKIILPPINARAIDNSQLATHYANQILNTRKLPNLFFKQIAIIAKDPSLSEQIQTRIIGDVITIRDSRSEETDYMIVGEKHDAQIQTGMHTATWTIRPIKYGAPFIIGTSEIGGPDIILV